MITIDQLRAELAKLDEAPMLRKPEQARHTIAAAVDYLAAIERRIAALEQLTIERGML